MKAEPVNSTALFDAYIFVDWSASNSPTGARPRRDAIWTGELLPDEAAPATHYHPTRQAAFEHVLTMLCRASERRLRVLCGFDFPYGYPEGFARLLTPADESTSWQNVWHYLARAITDSTRNVNNRFDVAEEINQLIGHGEGPFWGHPANQDYDFLSRFKSRFPYPTDNGSGLSEKRICERALPRTQEAWKLFGAGSVGSQALVGIPRVHALRYHPQLKDHSRVWPFETAFESALDVETRPYILHTEIWPGVVQDRVDALMATHNRAIKDELQVATLCEWAHELDKGGRLAGLLAQPKNLDARQAKRCVHEEGWVLGATSAPISRIGGQPT
ncbi:MAG: hypothetical protein PVH91_15480 [Pseudomonadales bacterium]|jgi:hypothetical protein